MGKKSKKRGRFYLSLLPPAKSTLSLEELKKLSLGVYACTEIQSPAEFIHAVDQAKRVVEGIRETGDYGTGIKLSLLGFDDDIKADPITFDLIRREEEME